MLPRIFTPPLRDLSDPDASWGHDLAWFCEEILREPLSDYQMWLGVHALEVLTKDKAREFAMLEDDPAAELAKIERLYAPPVKRGKRHVPNGMLRFTKVLILISRQNGKTDFVKKLIKYMLFRMRVHEIMAAAQTLNKSMDLWDEILREVEDHPKLSKQLASVKKLNGSQQLWTTAKCRYRPVGIDENAGRGDTNGFLYIDELRTQKSYTGVNSLEATTTVPDNGLIVITSNAGANHSVVLRDYRRLARKPIDEGTWQDTRLGIFEWSADPLRAIDDEEGWKQANPDLGNGRVTIATLRGYRQSKSEATFRTEHLCQWVDELDEDIVPIFPIESWSRRGVKGQVRLGYRALAVEVSPTTGRTKFVSAGRSTSGVHLEVAPYDEDLPVTGIVDRVKAFTEGNDPVAVVVDDKTDAVNLVEPLRREGIDVVTIGYANLSKAYRMLQQLYKDARLTHDSSHTWEDELRTARTREVNGGRETLIDRFKGEPQALVAATLAVWGLETFAPAAPQTRVKKTTTVIRGASVAVVAGHDPAWASAGRTAGKWR